MTLLNERNKGREEGLAEGIEKGIEKGRAEGFQEGRAEGLQEGRAEGLESAARGMFKKGITLETIAEILDISIEDVEKILT